MNFILGPCPLTPVLPPLSSSEFKSSQVAYEVQKNFANKFLTSQKVAKSLIDEASASLLDNLYLLLYMFVSCIQLFSYEYIFYKQHQESIAAPKIS